MTKSSRMIFKGSTMVFKDSKLLFRDAHLQRLLFLLVFTTFTTVLVYSNLKMDTKYFTNKFELPYMKVSLNTYRMFRNNTVMTQQAMKSPKLVSVFEDLHDIDPGFCAGNFVMPDSDANIDVDDDEDLDLEDSDSEMVLDPSRLYLLPPLPALDLVESGPVFTEEGLIRLGCNYVFAGVECRITGLVKRDKPYLDDTKFEKTLSETISLNYSVRTLLQGFVHRVIHNVKGDAKSRKSIFLNSLFVDANASNIRLLSNYLFLLGNDGDNVKLFDENEHKNLDTVQTAYESYNAIEQYVALLFQLFHLRVLNFAFLTLSFICLFSLHLFICVLLLCVIHLNSKDSYEGLENPNISFQDRSLEYFIQAQNSPEIVFEEEQRSLKEVHPDSEFVRDVQDDSMLSKKPGDRTTPSQGDKKSRIEELSKKLSHKVRQVEDNPLIQETKIIHFLFMVQFVLHYITYFIVLLIVHQMIDNCFTKMSENVTIQKISPTSSSVENNDGLNGENPAVSLTSGANTMISSHGIGGSSYPSSGSSLNYVLDIAGIVLNGLIFGSLHFLYAYSMYVYNSSITYL
ncbi:unnamed protein product [Ambrosiozyma monospora]|uniref:Unnamed protein product n=1 Tax=Ambrosiozyma monospora TaxID=43982 RepID=A0A9W7DD85_AMBMO|nr:unnamed protein product [Ambrosiozyma monospora]